MQIFVNEEPREFSGPLSISGLLEATNVLSLTGIAVAVNNEVIKKDQWDDSPLAENDRVLVIKATQGG